MLVELILSFLYAINIEVEHPCIKLRIGGNILKIARIRRQKNDWNNCCFDIRSTNEYSRSI